MASVIPDAVRIFREEGYETISGLSPAHFFNLRDVPFTTFVKNKKMFGSPGLALQEVMFLENFRDYIAPKRVLIVGNAYGWSTVVLALIFPGAKTVAIDIDPHGVAFTNDLVKRHGLAAEAVVAESPKDVKAAADRHLGGPIDFCLIDAMHDNGSLIADFGAVRAAAAPGCAHFASRRHQLAHGRGCARDREAAWTQEQDPDPHAVGHGAGLCVPRAGLRGLSRLLQRFRRQLPGAAALLSREVRRDARAVHAWLFLTGRGAAPARHMI